MDSVRAQHACVGPRAFAIRVHVHDCAPFLLPTCHARSSAVAHAFDASNATTVPLWVDLSPSVQEARCSCTCLADRREDTYEVDMDAGILTAFLTDGPLPASDHVALYSVLQALHRFGRPLRTHSLAVKAGGPWPAAIAKELGNHTANKSWTRLTWACGREWTYFLWI